MSQALRGFWELDAANEPLNPGSNRTVPMSAPPLLSRVTSTTQRKSFAGTVLTAAIRDAHSKPQ